MAMAIPFLLLLLLTAASAQNPGESQELRSALASLREHGYTLFTNAVSTSDLQYELLKTPSSAFTLFAPKDEMLFALDMATDAAVYVNTLRYHIIPNHRYSFADLQNLSSPFLDTLLPHFALLVGQMQDDDLFSEHPPVTVMVDGVRLASPNIFLGSRLAVHGIDGILLSGLNVTTLDSDSAAANRSDSGTDTDTDTLPTVESPPPTRNTPVEEMFGFDSNSKNSPPPLVNSPPPARNTPVEEMFGFDSNSKNAPPPLVNSPPPARNTPVEEMFRFDSNSKNAPPPLVNSPPPARNTPVEEMFQFDSKNAPPPLVESPPPARNTPIEEMFRSDSKNSPPPFVSAFDVVDIPAPAPVEGIPPTSRFDWDNNIPVEGIAPTVDGSLTPVKNHFDWRIVPGPTDGNIPVRAAPKMTKDQVQKLKNLAKKKRGRKGRRRHHHRRHADHLPNEL